jgi:hypothetical protein
LHPNFIVHAQRTTTEKMVPLMTMSDWTAAAGIFIQVVLLAGLIWYCVETRRLRMAAQSQLEALHTPCVTFLSIQRDAAEAVLNAGGAQGAMVLQFVLGDAVLINIGNGAAVNVSYILRPANTARPAIDGYVSLIPADNTRCTIPVPRGILQGHQFDCVVRYESLSQTRYETRLTVNNLILTAPFRFGKANK